MTNKEVDTGTELKKKEDFVKEFPTVFAKLIVKMQEIDDWCVQMTQDITKQELLLIDYVGEGSQLIMRDVAEFLQVPYSTATGIVDKLVKKEYLTRYYTEEDRRTILIGLSPKGKALKILFSDKRQEASEQIASILNEKERDQIISIFRKIEEFF